MALLKSVKLVVSVFLFVIIFSGCIQPPLLSNNSTKPDVGKPINNTKQIVDDLPKEQTNTTSPILSVSDLSGKIVIASYYPWYGFKDGEESWALDSTVGDHPLIGSYKSDDAKVIDYHISLAQDIGVDVFLADITIYEDENHQAEIFRQMLDQIDNSTRYKNFKMAIYYVGAAVNPDITDEELIRDVSHILTTYGDHNAYFRMDRRPVIFFYGSQNVEPSRWQDVFDEVNRTSGKQGVYVSAPDTWDYDTRFGEFLDVFDSMAAYADKYATDDEIINTLQQIKAQKPTAPIISTMFGGGGRIQKSGFDIDRSNGKYIQQRLELAQNASADWIEITSWNEWYEYNQVEPNVEYGFETVRYIREAIAEFKGNDLISLEDVSLDYTQTGTMLTVTNTGGHNLYYVTYDTGDTGNRTVVSYVIHPGESSEVIISGPIGEITAYLPDNTVVYAE